MTIIREAEQRKEIIIIVSCNGGSQSIFPELKKSLNKLEEFYGSYIVRQILPDNKHIYVGPYKCVFIRKYPIGTYSLLFFDFDDRKIYQINSSHLDEEYFNSLMYNSTIKYEDDNNETLPA